MHSLLQAAADTLLVRQVPPDRGGFEQVVFVAAGLAQIVTLVALILLLVIFFRMWKAQQAMQEQLSRLASKIDPMVASATAAAENVRDLTDAVKQDAMAAAEALSNATERVRDSVSGIADRIDDFGELLGRVTSKAEAVADIAEAAVSTFKAGRQLFRPQAAPPHRRGEPAPRRHERAGGRDDAPRRLDTQPAPDLFEEPREVHAAELDEPRHLADDGEGQESPYADEASTERPRSRRRRNRRRRGGGGAPGPAAGDAPAP
jgi:HAMP domain-containing protein